MQAMMMLLAQSQPKELATTTKPSTSLTATDEGQEASLFTDLLSGKLEETKTTQGPEAMTEPLPDKLEVLEELRMTLLQLDEDMLIDFSKQIQEEFGIELKESLPEAESSSIESLIIEADSEAVKEFIEGLLQKLNQLPTNEFQSMIAPIQSFIEQQRQVTPKSEDIPFTESKEEGRIFGKVELPTIPLELGKPYLPVPIQESLDQAFVESENNTISLQQIEDLLAQIEAEEDIAEVAPKLLHALAQWNPTTEAIVTGTSNSAVTLNGSKQMPQVWQELLQLYQQKMNFHSKNVYALDSKVSSSDVIRWLGKILGASVQTEKQVAAPPQMNTPMPMERIEQFIIQLPAKAEAKVQERALMEQFQTLIDRNRPVIMQPKGQLAITLNPANLGEMIVRFTQVDGETMVKILVTTATAKEMLEGNLKQLRHMFAPHQVVIERQEVATPQTEGTQKEEEHNEEEDRQENHPSENNKDKQEDDELGTFSSMFEELILNEKV